MVVIAAVALLVLSPSDLPKVMRGIGRFVGQIREMYRSMTAPLTDMSDELKKSATDARESVDIDVMWKDVGEKSRKNEERS